MMDEEVTVIERETYSFVHVLEDIGGFASVIFVIFRIFAHFVNKNLYMSAMIEQTLEITDAIGEDSQNLDRNSRRSHQRSESMENSSR